MQKVNRGFQTRKKIDSKKMKTKEEEELPDLKCEDVANATIKIQKVYRGFQTRKQLKVNF